MFSRTAESYPVVEGVEAVDESAISSMLGIG